MFYTPSIAEVPIPQSLSQGDRMWSWIKLGLCEPYFLVTVLLIERQDNLKLQHTEHLWFSSVPQLLELKNSECDELLIKQISVLLPGYLNGTDEFSLERLHEIWQDEETGNFEYLLENGKTVGSPEISNTNKNILLRLNKVHTK